jgi:hypothetical protein
VIRLWSDRQDIRLASLAVLSRFRFAHFALPQNALALAAPAQLHCSAEPPRGEESFSRDTSRWRFAFS